MSPEDNRQLLRLLRLKCVENDTELDTSGAADLIIPTKGGGHVEVPIEELM